MSQADALFAGEMPDIYDAYLVPLIFQCYAEEIAQRALDGNIESVLETAAGTGVVTRALTPLLGSDARYVVSDLNPPMLRRASSNQPPDKRISWQQADALDLPFDDRTFDLVCCQFGVMFFPDRIAGYREARRVLKPGGRFLFNVWDRIEENAFARVVTDSLALLYPEDPPSFLARTPHGYHDVGRIEADLRSAGFSNVVIQTIAHASTAPTPNHPAIAYCQGTPLRNEIEAKPVGSLQTATARAADAVREAYGEGPVSAKIQAHMVVARI